LIAGYAPGLLVEVAEMSMARVHLDHLNKQRQQVLAAAV